MQKMFSNKICRLYTIGDEFMPTEEEKIIKEYKNLCNRILNKDCTDLEHARCMIRIFNHYTERGKHCFDWKRVPNKQQQRRIYGDEAR